MENNIFIKMKKDKFNPDVESKLKQKDTERANTKFTTTNTIYNPITGVVPKKITSHNDLVLDKDQTVNKIELQNMIRSKEEERKNQDNIYKPVKTKVINGSTMSVSDFPNDVTDNQTNRISKMQNESRTNYIETYEEMKRGSLNGKQSQQTTNIQKNNYDNILVGLKGLGIIK